MSEDNFKEFDPGKKWHEKTGVGGLLDLSKIRKHMIKHNLFNVYKDFPEGGDPGDAAIRDPEGLGNDQEMPKVGSRKTHFGRNIDPEKLPPYGEDLLNPNPRVVSEKLLRRKEFKPIEAANLLMAAWIQFMVHDWFFHKNEDTKYHEIPLEEGDPFPDNPMKIEKTMPSPVQELEGVVAYENEHTHWWDGTQIYGKNAERLAQLRCYADGKLKIQENGVLERDTNGIDLTGFNENYWIGLSVLHTMFTLEHNSICDSLKAEYPEMEDEELFQKARLINTMIMAKIHTIEWTPAILYNKTLGTAMNANWDGIDANVDDIIDNYFKIDNILIKKAIKTVLSGASSLLDKVDDILGENVDAVRELDYVLNGIIGNNRDYFDTYHSLTEEFVAVYRLHSLIPDTISFRSHQDNSEIRAIDTFSTSQKMVRDINEQIPMKDIMYSMGTAHPGMLRLHNYPNFLMNFVGDDGKRIDLSTIDILRDRERQIPRYNEFRRQSQIGMAPVESFDALVGIDKGDDPAYPLADRQEDARLLAEVYEDVEKIDLLIGCLAEYPWPDGFGFGETAFQIFILMASRRLMCDRFFTDDFKEEIYTKWGYDYCNEATFTSILLKHYPEMANAVEGVVNPFFAWNKA